MGFVTEFGLFKDADGNLRDLHPETRARLRKLVNAARADATLKPLGTIVVNSGARTYAHQKALYTAYVNRGYTHPVVANPDRGYGSRHQVRPTSYKHGNLPNFRASAYAVDLKFDTGRTPNAAQRARLEQVAKTVGMLKTVPTEWWHFEPSKDGTIIARLGYGLHGTGVAQLQRNLNTVNNARLDVDGRFGPATYKAVQAWQAAARRTVTGDYDQADHTALTIQAAAPTSKTAAAPAPSRLALDDNDNRSLAMIRKRAQQIQVQNKPGTTNHTLAEEIEKLAAHALTT